ncbi:porin family protein [Candidatus Reidiella endopervernicosa]|uniref:Porin family protein n=1 Tax=Candidatus Reidiella endopervernicosa TaxID=2738883 RepID=A0A6N0I126_9GAMM|nr:porin family protein [Candidatus Reidiella endopervernicosa]
MSAQATASDISGYLGVGGGMSSYEEPGFDESDTAFKLYGGMRFNDSLGIELAYQDWGKPEGDYSGMTASVDISSVAGYLVAYAPISDQADFFAKLGFATWDVEVNIVGIGSNGSDGTDLAYGLGAAFNINENFSIRGEWEGISFEDGDGGDGSAFMVGAQLNF